jgi:hypothetical protein
VTSSSKTVIEDLALGFVITSNQPFSVFQNPFLRQLLSTLNPSVHRTIGWGRSSIRQRLADTFSSKKKLVQQELAASTSKIHLAFDLWTSPNRLAILAISAHFIDSKNSIQQRLLGLREQQGAHTGLNIASTLAEIASDWEIVDRIGCLVSDNASNNDICGEKLFRQIQPDLSVDDANDRRIRCYGHILNLVGRAFLYGEDFESFEQESQAYDAMNRIDDDLRHWRKRGPVGKLHNLVRWVRSSPQRSEFFKATIKEGEDGSGISLSEQSTLELQLLLNNETRWNSTFLMIERALRKQANIQTFLARNLDEIDPQKRIPVEDHLEMEDWRLLTELKEVLEPLYHQTMRTQGWAKQGGHGALWEILAGMEYLLEKMEDWKTFFDAPATPAISYRHRQRRQLSPALQALADHIRAEYTNQPPQQRYESLSDDSRVYFRLSVLNGWKKLNEYYTKLAGSPLYAAAVILHPGMGLRWLEAQWSSPEQLVWLRSAKDGLREYWGRWYASSLNSGPSTSRDEIQSFRRRPSAPETTQFDDWVQSRFHHLDPGDTELDRYLQLNPAQLQGVHNPLQWWISQRSAFPTLSQLALDILAIPAMSVDCERAFSLAKLTLTTQRLSMSPRTLEHFQCLKNWLQRGSICLGGFPFTGAAMEESLGDGQLEHWTGDQPCE